MSMATTTDSSALPSEVDVAIVGSGFSGLGMAVKLREAGIEDFVVLERGDAVGGTWWFNTYPGCGCDVPSHLYSFSFAPNPDWSRTRTGRSQSPSAASTAASRPLSGSPAASPTWCGSPSSSASSRTRG